MNEQREIRRIMEKVLAIDQRLEKYNLRMEKVLKDTNYPRGVTYDQLSKLKDNSYGQDIIFHYLK
jgi:division protein CdvB (Snf7/Vps24/ESCRT-III family)